MNKKLLFGFLCLLVASFCSCTTYRSIAYGAPGIDDYKIFENDTMSCSMTPWLFAKGQNEKIDTVKWRYTKKGDLVAECTVDSLFAYGETTAFIIIRNDSVMLERYYKGRKRGDVSTVFSISKTLTCMLAEIAMDEGFISSIDDPVRKYFPDLGCKRDTMFNHLTIRDLMDMRAALKHPESYGVNPFSKLARLFYGRNAMGQLKKLRMEGEPGKKHNYQSGATEVLGVVIERATGRPLAQYMEEKIWGPLGMEYDGLLSLDSKKNRTPKTFGGFAVTAIDLAKIGRLYLNMGNWNGVQILDSAWVRNAMTPRTDNAGYQLSWYTFEDRVRDSTGKALLADSISVVNRIKVLGGNPDQYEISKVTKDRRKKYIGMWLGSRYDEKYFYAQGILDQVLFLDPRNNTILIRLGHNDNFAQYTNLLHKVAKSF